MRSVVKKIFYNDRIIAVKLHASVHANIRAWRWWSGRIHDIIEEILEDGKGDTNTITIGDWNSAVGNESYRNIVGPHGLGRKNHRGQMLSNFCERKGLIVTNAWFRKPKRRLYTWKAPGDWSWHQLDYILVKHRFRNSVNYVQTLPGSDIDSDHSLRVA